MQLALGFDTDRESGFPPMADAPDGLGRVGEWDQVVIVHPDGRTGYLDSSFRPIDAQGDLRYERSGQYVAFAFHERLLLGVITFYFQVFIRDDLTGEVDWILATGLPYPE